MWRGWKLCAEEGGYGGGGTREEKHAECDVQNPGRRERVVSRRRTDILMTADQYIVKE